MKRSMILPFSVLAAVPFVMVLGNSMLIPVFPEMEKAMNLNQFQVGLLITAFSVPAGLLIPFTGAASDYVGRKKVMAPALVLYGLGGLIAGGAALLLERPYPAILAGRIVQGLGAGGTYQIALALTGDLFTSQERTKVVGLLEAANGLGKVVSPILGSLFALVAWYAPFFAYGLLAIPIAAAVWWIVEEPRKTRNKKPVRQYISSLKRIFADKGVSLLACYLAGMTGLFLLFGLLSFLSDELEAAFAIKGFAKGGVLAIPVGAMALTSYLTGMFLEGKEALHKPAIIAGLALACAAFTLLPFASGLAAILALVSGIGFGIGLILPPLNTLITGATESDERGLVTSLYGTVRFFGVAIGPPLFGLVVGAGKLLLFLGAAGIAAASALAALAFIRPQAMAADPGGSPSGSTARPHGGGGSRAGAGEPAG